MTASTTLSTLCVLVTSLLSGCAGGPVAKAGTRVLNAAGTIPKSQEYNNLYAMVMTEERPFDGYNFRYRNNAYVAGIEYDSPLKEYRHVPFVSWNHETLYAASHAHAFVPDHLPPLKEEDVIEIAQAKALLGIEEAPDAGQKNAIVVRVLCYAEDPRYKDCLKSLGAKSTSNLQVKNVLAHPTGAPYQTERGRYGLTFSKRYTQSGEVLPGSPKLPDRSEFLSTAPLRF